VDFGAVAVDPEEVKFARLELPPEEEQQESREKALGLLDFNDSPRSMREREVPEEAFVDEDIEAPPESKKEEEP
jgi:small subunit ribosomal protein S6